MALILNDISLHRGGKILFEGLSLTVQAGEMIEIIGSNGCGKTSFLKMLAHQLPFRGGTIQWPHASQKPLYLNLKSGLEEQFTVKENLHYCWLLEEKKTLFPSQILYKFNIVPYKDQLVCRLSAGQRQRVHLTRLWIISRRLWLLDEPLTSLDEEGKALFADTCHDFQKNGGIILIATPSPQYNGRVICLEDYQKKGNFFYNTWENL